MSSGGSRVGRWLELGAVVLLLVASAWLGRLMVHNYVLHGDEPEAPGLRFAPASVPAKGLDGASADLAVAGEEQRLILLVLSTDCPFCQRNMPNWVRLVERLPAADAGGPRVLTLSVDPAPVTTAYLRRHGLETPVRLVEPDVLRTIGVSGYPGTVAIDPRTRELRPYAGVLDDGDLDSLVAWAAAPPSAALAAAQEAGR